jgi:hypothetical protein
MSSLRQGLMQAGWLLLAPWMVAAQAQPVAMVTEQSASCSLSSAAGARSCGLLDTLSVGDELSLSGDGRSVVVYFEGNVQHVFTAPARLRIGPARPALLAGAPGESRPMGRTGATGLSTLKGMNLGQAALVLRGQRRERITLLWPVDTLVLEPQPLTFRWRADVDGGEYRFVLTSESGQQVLEATVDAGHFRMPDSVSLEPEQLYEWQVELRGAGGAIHTAASDFSLASQSRRERLLARRPAASAGVSEQVLYAAALEDEGARAAARPIWEALLARYPDNPALRRLLR